MGSAQPNQTPNQTQPTQPTRPKPPPPPTHTNRQTPSHDSHPAAPSAHPAPAAACPAAGRPTCRFKPQMQPALAAHFVSALSVHSSVHCANKKNRHDPTTHTSQPISLNSPHPLPPPHPTPPHLPPTHPTPTPPPKQINPPSRPRVHVAAPAPLERPVGLEEGPLHADHLVAALAPLRQLAGLLVGVADDGVAGGGGGVGLGWGRVGVGGRVGLGWGWRWIDGGAVGVRNQERVSVRDD